MSYYADDIRRIAKQQENKPGIGGADVRVPVTGNTKAMASILPEESGLVSPLQFTALTYDDTKDVIIEDTSAAQHTIKTVATAKIVDANGKEILIDEIIFTEPPP